MLLWHDVLPVVHVRRDLHAWRASDRVLGGCTHLSLRYSTCPGEHDLCCAGLVCIRMTLISIKMHYALVQHHRDDTAVRTPTARFYTWSRPVCVLDILATPSISTTLFTRRRCGEPTPHQEITLVCICRLRMCLYVTMTWKDICMLNNFYLISLRQLIFDPTYICGTGIKGHIMLYNIYS